MLTRMLTVVHYRTGASRASYLFTELDALEQCRFRFLDVLRLLQKYRRISQPRLGLVPRREFVAVYCCIETGEACRQQLLVLLHLGFIEGGDDGWQRGLCLGQAFLADVDQKRIRVCRPDLYAFCR